MATDYFTVFYVIVGYALQEMRWPLIILGLLVLLSVGVWIFRKNKG